MTRMGTPAFTISSCFDVDFDLFAIGHIIAGGGDIEVDLVGYPIAVASKKSVAWVLKSLCEGIDDI